MLTRKIRVLVVDDSLFMREFISSGLNEEPGIEVVGKAINVFDAQDKINSLNPDVMTLDINMPQMDGIAFLRKMMPRHPLPTVVVSSVSGRVFDAMNAGAVDFVTKTGMRNEQDRRAFLSELSGKIKVAAVAKIGQRNREVASRPPVAPPPARTPMQRVAAALPPKPAAAPFAPSANSGNSIIAIGASTGGTEATQTILRDLRADLPGIVVVQHMPPVFTRLYAERLNSLCTMEVKEAEHGDAILPGRVLIGQGGLQMTVVRRGNGLYVECLGTEKISGHCPSVDNLFSSIAKLRGLKSLGIILTGMGSDGAQGLLDMKNAGAQTFGQDRQTCVVYGMPAVAEKIGAVQTQLPIQSMAAKIYEWHGR